MERKSSVIIIILLIIQTMTLQGNNPLPNASFVVLSDFKDMLVLKNNSTNASHYLWEFEVGNQVIQTVTENPTISLSNANSVKIRLKAYNDLFDDDLIEEEVALKSLPPISISTEDVLICGNAVKTTFYATELEQADYYWNLREEHKGLTNNLTGQYSKQLFVDWLDVNFATQIPIRLTVNQQPNEYERVFFTKLLLVPPKVPPTGNMIRKAPTSNVLIYVVENPEAFLYNWKQTNKQSGEILININTDKNFWEFQTIDTERYAYEVTLSDAMWRYCKASFSYSDQPMNVKASKTDNRDFLEQKQPDSFIQLYPNPSQGVINLRFNNDLPETIHLTVFDQLGRIVLHQKLVEEGFANEHTVRLPVDSKGVFYLLGHTSSGMHFTEKIIVR